ncbi:DsbA family protein, partial [Streptomyces xanthophaeus]|uniref:DsbA family protein n=1 Tax=Streptomyces xanthophaeus TaxID=67385 RepID=UPI003653E408
MPRPATDTAEHMVSASMRSSRAGRSVPIHPAPAGAVAARRAAPPGRISGTSPGRASSPGPGRAARVPVGPAARGWETVRMTDSVILDVWCELQCPDCHRALDDVRALRARYGDRLDIRLRHFPLEKHKHAFA